MEGAQDFMAQSGHGTQGPLTPKSRRSLPPELVHAFELERLYWSLYIKGLDYSTVAPVPRARRLGIRFLQPLANPTIGINAALREIERLRPKPALIPANYAVRRRAAALERWFCNEIAPCVMWFLLQPVLGKGEHHSITRGMDLVVGLTNRHGYLLGDQLSSADITAAAVLAPIARHEGWVWAGRSWIPNQLFGCSPLANHAGSNWVRGMYERHGLARVSVRAPDRPWLP